MHTHLGGECPHKCSYCYVQKNRFGVPERYQGKIRVIPNEFSVQYGDYKIIFIEHMNDMFAEGISSIWVQDILLHCKDFPDNKYVFQTKNPQNALKFQKFFPPNFLFGTTIETDNTAELFNKTLAPLPIERFEAMLEWSYKFPKKIFVTIEPIMSFNVATLSGWIKGIDPLFINIGADSKHSSLNEPSKELVEEFIKIIQKTSIKIEQKHNLDRLLK